MLVKLAGIINSLGDDLLHLFLSQPGHNSNRCIHSFYGKHESLVTALERDLHHQILIDKLCKIFSKEVGNKTFNIKK